uniref:Uncharacterized protein n=1 Tax=Compsopogon caeruleus TaxID=31354 RepID=A0A7S1XEC8_9RHOD
MNPFQGVVTSTVGGVSQFVPPATSQGNVGLEFASLECVALSNSSKEGNVFPHVANARPITTADMASVFSGLVGRRGSRSRRGAYPCVENADAINTAGAPYV